MDQLPASPNREPNRLRWLRFSLRALLIVMTAAAIALGVFAYQVQEATRQEAALKNIEALGGVPLRVTVQDGIAWSGGKIPAPGVKWLHETLGDAYFVYCPLISLRSQSVTRDTVRSMIPLIEQIRLKDGLNEAGKSYIALDTTGNPNIDDSVVELIRSRLPQCRVISAAANSSNPYSR